MWTCCNTVNQCCFCPKANHQNYSRDPVQRPEGPQSRAPYPKKISRTMLLVFVGHHGKRHGSRARVPSELAIMHVLYDYMWRDASTFLWTPIKYEWNTLPLKGKLTILTCSSKLKKFSKMQTRKDFPGTIIISWRRNNSRLHAMYNICVTSTLSTWMLEQFSIECRKTKTKVITLANHKEHRQSSEPIKTRSKYM